MKKILAILVVLFSMGNCFAHVTPGTTQVTIRVTRPGLDKQIKVILASDVAARLESNALTAGDLQKIEEATELVLGHVPFHTVNPCHKPAAPFGPNMIDEDRKPSNCSETQ